MFSDEDVKRMKDSTPAVPGTSEWLSDARCAAIMHKTAELLAERGGTMTDEELASTSWDMLGHAHGNVVREHIAALGARNAVLEKELKALHAGAAGTNQARILGMEQHISDLEKSLENARKDRDSTQEALREVDKHRNALLERVKRLEEAGAPLVPVLKMVCAAFSKDAPSAVVWWGHSATFTITHARALLKALRH